MDEPPTTIEDAGLFPLSEYFKQPDDNKYIVRLNFSAKLWRGIDSEIKNLLESVNSIVAVKKKSPFDF